MSSDESERLHCVDCRANVEVLMKSHGGYFLQCGCHWARLSDVSEVGVWTSEARDQRTGGDHS